MPIQLIGEIQGIKKILDLVNTKADDLIVKKEQDNASVRIADIYREASITVPATQAADPDLWVHAEHLAAELVVKRLSQTLEGKMAAQKDVDDTMNQIRLHIGVQPGQSSDVLEPNVYVGPTMTSLGDAIGSDD